MSPPPHVPPTHPPINVAVVDDHPLVVAGVTALLAPFAGRVRVLHGGGVPAAGEADVVLLDTLGRPDAPSRVDEVIRATGAKVVLFDWALTRAGVEAAMRGGACGYLPKSADGRGIAEAVEAVHEGRTLHSAPTPDDAPGAGWPGRPHGLTARESQVLNLIVTGLANSEIADLTWLSPNTVKTYIRTAYRKIGVTSRAQAVRWCLDHGFPMTAPTES